MKEKFNVTIIRYIDCYDITETLSIDDFTKDSKEEVRKAIEPYLEACRKLNYKCIENNVSYIIAKKEYNNIIFYSQENEIELQILIKKESIL